MYTKACLFLFSVLAASVLSADGLIICRFTRFAVVRDALGTTLTSGVCGSTFFNCPPIRSTCAVGLFNTALASRTQVSLTAGTQPLYCLPTITATCSLPTPAVTLNATQIACVNTNLATLCPVISLIESCSRSCFFGKK